MSIRRAPTVGRSFPLGPSATASPTKSISSRWRPFGDQFGRRYRGRSVIFAYDLRNEPGVGWNTPTTLAKWNESLQSRYGSAEELARAWGVAPQAIHWGQQREPLGDGPPRSRPLLDFDHFREGLADAWTRRQTAAIKAVDPQALVTVGFLSGSVPAHETWGGGYSCFHPQRQAKFLDFLEVHLYPNMSRIHGGGRSPQSGLLRERCPRGGGGGQTGGHRGVWLVRRRSDRRGGKPHQQAPAPARRQRGAAGPVVPQVDRDYPGLRHGLAQLGTVRPSPGQRLRPADRAVYGRRQSEGVGPAVPRVGRHAGRQGAGRRPRLDRAPCSTGRAASPVRRPGGSLRKNTTRRSRPIAVGPRIERL